jgi:ABC-2 type transport system ATP-binding protein
VAGRASAVEEFVRGREALSTRSIGGLGTAVVQGVLNDEDRETAARLALEISPVSLQDLVAAYGLGEAEQADQPDSDSTALTSAR